MQYLDDHAGLWLDAFIVDPLGSGDELRRSAWMVTHDGHLSSAFHIYSPEAVAARVVDAAVELYKSHGGGHLTA